ncbi:YegS/Rv2252/BmrU family lipid kinase [Propioniciclava sinopodophylli]|uniref:YegS/Rv2252/BmrU family lipid kinase n=1 Tax=Propioniciclava sinopodophylli TaxID=1837344 RepID=A0A4Q9KCJ5_9ACTN|nr:YegS/Rv2252/BmrU family lipid kinase [Propioniciclava sinopodophylli]TBT82555.1 YegS/Rv2252/BmrU family lipid kinase [Propioniciclava sinopodophylli]
MRHVALVVNPAAGHGRGRRLTSPIELRLMDAGVRVTRTLARSQEHAWEACFEAVNSGVDSLAVVGGDGMAHIGLNACANSGVPLGVIPAGTGNDFSRGVGNGQTWRQATDAVASGHTRTIDLAEVRGGLYHREVEYVGCVVSTGFDERVNSRANNAKVDLGHLSYIGAVLAEMRAFRPLHYRLELDGERRDLDAILIAVINSGIFGGGIKLEPTYDLTDGLLDIVIVHPVSWRVLAALLPKIAAGKEFDHPALERLKVRRARVDGDGLFGMADGEPLGRPPFTITAAPGALDIHVLHPAKTGKEA